MKFFISIALLLSLAAFGSADWRPANCGTYPENHDTKLQLDLHAVVAPYQTFIFNIIEGKLRSKNANVNLNDFTKKVDSGAHNFGQLFKTTIQEVNSDASFVSDVFPGFFAGVTFDNNEFKCYLSSRVPNGAQSAAADIVLRTITSYADDKFTVAAAKAIGGSCT